MLVHGRWCLLYEQIWLRWMSDDEEGEDGKKPFVDSSTLWTDHEPFELLMTLVFKT